MSITSPKGFRAAGVEAGIKRHGGLDLAIVLNDGPQFDVAGVFTSNRVQAAPVIWSRNVVSDGSVRAIVINSGGANACTGSKGFADARLMAERVSDKSSLRGPGSVVVCSTGLIGERLPMDKVLAGIDAATSSAAGGQDAAADAARAIMTTDTVPKTAVIEGEGYRIAGMAKGAGMLAPALATMLVVITTDASMASEQLDKALRTATRRTFDRLDSDGAMSTNDSVVIMASGASDVVPELHAFVEQLTSLCADLAQQLLADAEGASKDIAITVQSAATEDEAVEVARAVSRSNLFKCAVHGEDPNWGRVLSAVGTTKARFHVDEIDVAINNVWICRGGSIGDTRDQVDMSGRSVNVTIALHAGRAQATVLTNDLTAAYVHENSSYSS